MSYGQQQQHRSYFAGGRQGGPHWQQQADDRLAQPPTVQSIPPLAPLPPDPPRTSSSSYNRPDARFAHQNTSSSYSTHHNHHNNRVAPAAASSSAVRYRQTSASLSRPPPSQQHKGHSSAAAAVSSAPVLYSDRPPRPPPAYASGTAAAVTAEEKPLPPTPPVHRSSYIPEPQQQRTVVPSYENQSPEERARQLGYSNSIRTNSTATPGADNLGETAAGGGIAGIAYGVASANERDSGVRALQAIQDQAGDIDVPFGTALPSDRRGEGKEGRKRFSMDSSREDNPYIPEPRGYRGRDSRPPMAALGAVRGGGAAGGIAAAQAERQYAVGHSNALTPAANQPEDPFGSRASLAPSLPEDAYAGGIPSHRRSLPPPPPPEEPPSYAYDTTPPRHHFPAPAAAAAVVGGGLGAGLGAAGAAGANPAAHLGTYLDNPLQRRSQLWDHDMENFNPNDIEDDGDDGLQAPPTHGRRSVLSFTGNRSRSSLNAPAAGAAGGAAAAGAGGIGAALGGLTSRNASGRYNPVSTTENGGPGDPEKSEWLKGQTRGRRRMALIIGGVVLLLAIIGGVVGGVLGSRAHQNSSSSGSQDLDKDGELDANSASIKSLMNNANLHRVFPGVAYTPLNAQYPECLSNMPSQNNVTKDLAVLSQMTNTIRLYGTDCNQTEMVIEAMNRLNIKDMKIWLAVWLNNNDTTNARGLNAMHDILGKYGTDPFDGVILGNEVLYRKDLTASQLSDIISQTRSNFTQNKVSLPIAVADLGDNWTKQPQLVADIDVVMSNVHPFFGGVPVDQAAGWAWDFWQNNDVKLTAADTSKKNVISEIGWPSGGGQDCGSDTAPCSTPGQGAVAGIDEMNKFMDSFVCQSLKNNTNYFWFEAFDEPWKVQFNEPGKEWEDKWGLMDANRNLKKGLKIPNCPGQSIPSSSAR